MSCSIQLRDSTWFHRKALLLLLLFILIFVYTQLRLNHTVLGTHSELVGFVCFLSLMALLLSNGSLKVRSGLEPVPR